MSEKTAGPGDVVKIFYDSKTEKRFEGMARLVSRLNCFAEIPPRELWQVIFLDEDYVIHRRVIQVSKAEKK